jgi:predicted SAM-dependent methyltransferase
MNFKEKLLKENKTRWLDVGCGGNFEEGFYYLDIFPKQEIPKEARKDYFRADMRNLSGREIKRLGKFDLIRMQHFLEHLSYEDAQKALINCAKILKKDGIILISVPDLRVHIKAYLNDKYKNWKGFQWWANKRIPKDAPNSFYFSIFAHSMLWEEHKWCYDIKGLKYVLGKTKKYKNIKELKFGDSLSNNSFTHNRPEEDVCVIANKA